MTSPRVEKQRQVAYTTTAVANKTTASKTTAPLFNTKQTQNDNLMGLQVERGKGVNKGVNSNTQEVYLQSGRKIVIQKLSDGRSVRKYYSADGKQLKPEYFKKVEGEVKVTSDGRSYTVTKNGQTKTYKTKTGAEVKIAQQQAILNKTKKEQGFIGKTWDAIKNNVLTFCDSSDKAQNQINAEKKLLQQILQGKVSKKDFKEVTGLECTQENLQKFKNGKLNLKSAEKVSAYKEGQEMAVDVTSDVVSGVAAYGAAAACIAGGIAAAPFTAGASLGAVAVGVGIAAGVGAATKVFIKGGDVWSGGKKYSLKQAGKDATIGAVSGALAPITLGVGGAITKTLGKGIGATSLRLAAEGGVFGFADGGTRSALEGDSIGDVALNSLKGAGIGIVAGNILGHGGKALGKGSQYLYEKLTPVYKGNGFTYRKNLLGKKYKLQLDKPDLEPLQFDLPSLKKPNWNPTNLTNELERCHYGKAGIEKLLQENPNLTPIVGSLPQKWGRKLASKKGLNQIDEIFYSFSKKYYDGTLMHEDVNKCAESLSKILKTNVKIQYLDEGMVGCTYTIDVEGQKFVFKCFKSHPQVSQAGHGNWSELSSAVYASKHDPNHFARFYMGRFGTNEDGYMLTKFVEYSKSNDNFKLSNYTTSMSSGDKGHNVHGNTIIDYGAAWEDAILTRFNTNEKKILRLLVNAIDNNKTDELNIIISKYSASQNFINPVKYIKGLVHNKAFSSKSSKDGISFALDYFIERSNCLKMLNIETVPSLNNAEISILPYSKETKGHISVAMHTPWWEAGEKFYGLSYKEWKTLGL